MTTWWIEQEELQLNLKRSSNQRERRLRKLSRNGWMNDERERQKKNKYECKQIYVDEWKCLTETEAVNEY